MTIKLLQSKRYSIQECTHTFEKHSPLVIVITDFDVDAVVRVVVGGGGTLEVVIIVVGFNVARVVVVVVVAVEIRVVVVEVVDICVGVATADDTEVDDDVVNAVEVDKATRI